MKDVRLADGRERVVRHGHGPERLVQTEIGAVPVRRVKIRDRGADAGRGGERLRFTSALLPRWARRTRSLDALLPILYLRGVSMGDFQEGWSENSNGWSRSGARRGHGGQAVVILGRTMTS